MANVFPILIFPPMKNKESKPSANIMTSAFHIYITGEGLVILPDNLQMQ